jgi:hypothetical protein
LHDGGDLVLHWKQYEYCRGRILDTSGKPVTTSIRLGNGSAVFPGDTTRSDTDGRFRLAVSVEYPDRTVLYTPEYHCPKPVEVRWGDRDVTVATARQAGAAAP